MLLPQFSFLCIAAQVTTPMNIQPAAGMPAFLAWWENFSIPRQETARLVKKIIMPMLLECSNACSVPMTQAHSCALDLHSAPANAREDATFRNATRQHARWDHTDNHQTQNAPFACQAPFKISLWQQLFVKCVHLEHINPSKEHLHVSTVQLAFTHQLKVPRSATSAHQDHTLQCREEAAAPFASLASFRPHMHQKCVCHVLQER
jgi:hypothetical protein